MAVNSKSVPEKVLHLLKGYGFQVTSLDRDGKVTSDAKEATRFSVQDPNILVRISAADDAINLKTSEDLNNHLVRTQLQQLARDYLMAFNYEVYEKPVLPKGEKMDIESNKEQDMVDVMGESFNELAKIRQLAGLSESTGNEPGSYYERMNSPNAHPQDKEAAQYGLRIARQLVSDIVGDLPNRDPRLILDAATEEMANRLPLDEIGSSDWSIFKASTIESLGLNPTDYGYTWYRSRNPSKNENSENDMNNVAKAEPTQQESVFEAKDHKIEAYGVRGMDSKKWRKTFKDEDEMTAWAEKNDAEIQGHRDLEEGIAESSFGPMAGSSKSSYQGLDAVKVVIRHNRPVNEEVRGARSRNIHSIYIQRGGERFKMQENNLMAARAMARHMNNGGEMHDTVGTQIHSLAEDYRKLREFVGYVNRAKLINEGNEEYVRVARESIGSIRNMLGMMSKSSGYSSAINEMDEYFQQNTEIMEGDLDLESQFTETHFDDKVAQAMTSLRGAVARQQSYMNQITMAAESETFDGMTDMLRENDIVDFSTPRDRLATQIGQMGASAQSEQLGAFLQGLSSRIGVGGKLNQFEYSTVKSCLLSASQPQLKESTNKNVLEGFERILNKYITY